MQPNASTPFPVCVLRPSPCIPWPLVKRKGRVTVRCEKPCIALYSTVTQKFSSICNRKQVSVCIRLASVADQLPYSGSFYGSCSSVRQETCRLPGLHVLSTTQNRKPAGTSPKKPSCGLRAGCVGYIYLHAPIFLRKCRVRAKLDCEAARRIRYRCICTLNVHMPTHLGYSTIDYDIVCCRYQ